MTAPVNDDTPKEPVEAPLIAGKYRLGKLLFDGDSSRIYEANQTTLARPVAIRLLAEDATERDQRQLLSEARLLARLPDPSFVEVYELGTHEGTPFVAMELLHGETLRDRLDREGGPLPLHDVAPIGQSVLGALRVAHEASVVHRGLTPRNVFLADKRGKMLVKIADLGERAEADPRLDLYGAGVVLYEALTGRLPFEAVRPVETEEQELNEAFLRPPLGPSEINLELGLDADAFATRALAPHREERFQSAAEMLDAWCSIAALEPYMNA